MAPPLSKEAIELINDPVKAKILNQKIRRNKKSGREQKFTIDGKTYRLMRVSRMKK